MVLGIENSGTLSGMAGPRGLQCHWDLLCFLWIAFHLRQVFSSGGTSSYGFMGRELLFVGSFSESSENRRGILPLTPKPIPKRDAIERRKENESHLGKCICLLQTKFLELHSLYSFELLPPLLISEGQHLQISFSASITLSSLYSISSASFLYGNPWMYLEPTWINQDILPSQDL